MRLSEITSALPALLERTPEDPEIAGVEHDSRRVIPGSLFVARRGGTDDGHAFIPQAIERGAAAVVGEDQVGQLVGKLPYLRVPDSAEALAWLCAAFHGFPARRLVMIGVTGTDGKTTTCSLIHGVLLAAGIKAGLISTVNAVIGDQVLETGLHTTTPEAPDIQRYLAQMAAAGMTHCVLETTSHGLAQHRVTGCEFDVAAVTNITHEHLDFHGSLDNYRAAKAGLFEALADSYQKPGVEKLAVLNADDESFDYLRQRLRSGHISYGLADSAGVRARQIVYDPVRTRFSVDVAASLPHLADTAGRFSFSGLEFSTALAGEYNVYNCLAAIAVGLKGLGLAPEAVVRGVEAMKGVPGRMERIDLGQSFAAIVDFAHSPNALRRALETVRRMMDGPARDGGRAARGRVIVVFGSAGLRDVAKRKWMGEIAAELADFVVVTAEDPRTEPLDALMAESAEGARNTGAVEGKTLWRIADRGEAIQFAVDLAQPGDAVIACGKAHEQSMCFGAVEYPWDDRVAMRAALSRRLGLPGPEMPRLPTSSTWVSPLPAES